MIVNQLIVDYYHEYNGGKYQLTTKKRRREACNSCYSVKENTDQLY